MAVSCTWTHSPPSSSSTGAYRLGVAYRLTGTRTDAEDAVQDAWLRLARLPEVPGSQRERAGIRELRAWLSTVVARLCLDRMRSAAARREHYVGPWLPEPLVSTPGGPPDPLDEVVRSDDGRMAALVVLERFLAALAGGDVHAVVALLHRDAVLVGDSGGTERTTRRPVVGAGKVARFLLGLRQRYGPARLGAVSVVLANGDLALLLPASPGDPGHPVPVARRVSCFTVRDGLVAAIYDIVNPDKLSSLDRPQAPVPGTPPPR